MLTRFLGGYPRLGVHNPEAYLTALKVTFAEYPEWAGEEACRRLKLLDPDKVPSEGRCRKALEDSVHFERMAQGFARDGQKMLTDRAADERRAAARNPMARYNLLVSTGRPGFDQMVERAKTADPADFVWVPEGIWVPVAWHVEAVPGARFVGRR